MSGTELPAGWDESGWGGRTRKDGYRRNPASRFIADADAPATRDNEEEIRVSLGLGDGAASPATSMSGASALFGTPPADHVQGPLESKGGTLGGTEIVVQRRLDSLDVFRGITIALMIFVDDLNTRWPGLHHARWDGLHLADVVMPFFLWMVGFSIPIAVGRRLDRGATSGQVARQILSRTVKLFVLGVVISGGGLPDGDCTESADIARVCVGFNLHTIRISGILQRIAVCYMVVALVTLCSMVKMEPILRRIERGVTEHWSFEERISRGVSDEDRLRALLGNRELGIGYGVGMNTDTGLAGPSCTARVCHSLRYFRTYLAGWLLTLVCVALYLGFTLLTSVPDYPNEARGEQVICGGARARHDPGCNAVGYWDRLILQPQHMYHNPTFRNLHECQTPPESAQPTWCTMPFEAEGVVSSILSCVSVVFGTFTGQVLLALQASGASMSDKLWQWVPLSLLCAALGLLLHFVPVHDPRPFGGCRGLVCLNKNLWSLSCKCSSSVSDCLRSKWLLRRHATDGWHGGRAVLLLAPDARLAPAAGADGNTQRSAHDVARGERLALAVLRGRLAVALDGVGRDRLGTSQGLLGCVVTPMPLCCAGATPSSSSSRTRPTAQF